MYVMFIPSVRDYKLKEGLTVPLSLSERKLDAKRPMFRSSKSAEAGSGENYESKPGDQ